MNFLRKNSIAVILLLGFLFRIFLLKFHWTVGFDEVHYLRLGLIGARDGFAAMMHPYWPPFYPFLIMLFSKVIANGELAARMVNIVASTISVYLIYRICKEFYSEKIALLAAATYAFYPSLAFESTTVLAETVYTTLGIAAIWSGWLCLKKQSFIYAFLVGFWASCAYLAKPEGIYYVMVFVGILMLIMIVKIKAFPKKLPVFALLSIFGYLLLALPYMFYVKDQMGIWSLSMKFQVNQQFAALAWAKDKSPEARFSLTEDNHYLPTDLAYHEGNFGVLVDQSNPEGREKKVDIGGNLLIKKYVENFYKINRVGIPVVLTFAPFILIVLGLFGRKWTYDEFLYNGYILMFVGAYWFVVIPLFHINLRYFEPQLPFVFIWLALGLMSLKEWIEGTLENIKDIGWLDFIRKIKLLPVAASAIFLLGFAYVPQFGKIIKRTPINNDYWADAVELKKAGEWLKQHMDGEAIIMTENKAVEYYAGLLDTRKSVSFPINKDFNRILAYARYKNVDYMVITDRYKTMFTNLQFLVKKENVPDALKLVYEDLDPSGVKTVIYQLIKP